MGFASIIATALGIILLIVTAYVLVSGVLVTSETVVAAQKDMTAIQVEMLGTSLEITEATNNNITVTNTGSEPIRDLDKMDVYMRFSENEAWNLYRTTSTGWSVDIYKNEDWTPYSSKIFNPGNTIKLSHSIGSPYEVKIVTPNGISAYNKTPNYP
jgi:flagellar protein FlaF